MFGRCLAHLADHVRKGTGALEPLGPAWSLVTQRLPAGLVDAAGVAALTGVGAARRARRGGRARAIGGQELALDAAKGPAQVDHDGPGRLEHAVTDAGAEVTQVSLSWNVVMQASHLPGAAPCVRVVQSVADARVIDLLRQCGRPFQDDEARWVVTVVASRASVGGTE